MKMTSFIFVLIKLEFHIRYVIEASMYLIDMFFFITKVTVILSIVTKILLVIKYAISLDFKKQNISN